MKKFLIIFSIFSIAFFTSAFAQSSMQPTRSAIYINSTTEFIAVSDDQAHLYYSYPLSKDKVLIKVSLPEKMFKVFIATKDEYSFLKKEIQTNSLQVVLDDETFVGFTKIIFY